jgi:nicotinamidase-related amidase
MSSTEFNRASVIEVMPNSEWVHLNIDVTIETADPQFNQQVKNLGGNVSQEFLEHLKDLDVLAGEISDFTEATRDVLQPIWVYSDYKEYADVFPSATHLFEDQGEAHRVIRAEGDPVLRKTEPNAVPDNLEYFQDLKAKGVKGVVVTGLYTDICVLETVQNLQKEGFNVVVVEDLVDTNLPEARANSIKLLKDTGVLVIDGQKALTHINTRTLDQLINENLNSHRNTNDKSMEIPEETVNIDPESSSSVSATDSTKTDDVLQDVAKTTDTLSDISKGSAILKGLGRWATMLTKALGPLGKVLMPVAVAGVALEVGVLTKEAHSATEQGFLTQEAFVAYEALLAAHSAQGTLDPSGVGGEVLVQKAFDEWSELYKIEGELKERLEPGSLYEMVGEWTGLIDEEAPMALDNPDTIMTTSSNFQAIDGQCLNDFQEVCKVDNSGENRVIDEFHPVHETLVFSPNVSP